MTVNNDIDDDSATKHCDSHNEQEEPDEIWGGKEWLDPRLVREGGLDELKRLKHFDVYEAVDESEATGQTVDAKWVDRQKREFGQKQNRSKAGRSPWNTCSLVHRTPRFSERFCRIWRRTRTGCCSWQTSHQRITRLQCDRPVRATTNRPERKRKTLEAEAGDARPQDSEPIDHYASVVEKVLGQTRSLVDSCAFAQQEDGTISAIWGGDDLVGSSYRANMEVMKEKLHEALECNTGELVGVDADLAKEATFTKRTIRCVPDAGWDLEADTKHAKTLLQWFQCEDARGSPVPGSKKHKSTARARDRNRRDDHHAGSGGAC